MAKDIRLCRSQPEYIVEHADSQIEAIESLHDSDNKTPLSGKLQWSMEHRAMSRRDSIYTRSVSFINTEL